MPNEPAASAAAEKIGEAPSIRRITAERRLMLANVPTSGWSLEMINGSVIAPFRHESTWPNGVLTMFRSAVYYLHVHVPGRDPANYLRELIMLIQREEKPRESSSLWAYLKDTCHKVVHVATQDITDNDMVNLVTNILILANLLLIRDYGLGPSSTIRFHADALTKNEEHDKQLKAGEKAFSANIDNAYESLENSINRLKQSDGKLRGSLKFEKGVAVLSPIPSYHHIIPAQDLSAGKLVCVINDKDKDKCGYEFRPYDPIGWVMTSGNRAKDRFADDAMSSAGVFGTKNIENW